MIHNLSDYTLTEDEFSVLIKGLLFVPTPTKTFKQEINKPCNKFKTYFFRSNIHDRSLSFQRKSNWIAPSSDNPILVDMFTRIEPELTFVNTLHQTYNNLTLREKASLISIKNTRFIVIKPYDKGGSICIMSRRDYLSKIYTHLQEDNTYKPLTHVSISRIAIDALTLIEDMHSEDIIDKATIEFLLPPKNTRKPLFYGLPKINKPDCPLRPIISGYNGPTGHLFAYSTFLSNLFLAIFHLTLKTQNIFWTLLKILHPSQPLLFSHCWCHVLTCKHPIWRKHSSLNWLHEKMQVPAIQRLSTLRYNQRFDPQI